MAWCGQALSQARFTLALLNAQDRVRKAYRRVCAPPPFTLRYRRVCVDWQFGFYGRHAGGCPAASNFLLLRQKESHQRKGDPAACDPCAALRGNLRCSVQPGSSSNSLRSDNRSPCSGWPCTPRRRQKGWEIKRQKSGAYKDTPWRVLVCVGIWFACPILTSPRCGWAEERRQKRIRAGTCLRRSRVCA